jgi:adenosylhomocysteine nucleosidase/futalosine hydrolase
MKNIVVITPTESESVFLLERGIRVFHCGVGMAECAAATAKLICEEKPQMVILAGIAGTYSEDIMIGETVIVESETVADLGRYSGGEFTELFQKTYHSTLSPVDTDYKVVRSNTVNTAGCVLINRSEAEIENMEGAAFFAVCERYGIPAMEIRTVSNSVGEVIGTGNMEIATMRLAQELEVILQALPPREICGQVHNVTVEN